MVPAMTHTLMQPRTAKTLEADVRSLLEMECGGEWERVTTDGRGGYLVHNSPDRARAYLATVDMVKAPIEPTVVELPADIAAELEEEGEGAVDAKSPSPFFFADLMGEPDWKKLDLANGADRLRQVCEKGLPPGIKHEYLPAVHDLEGFDHDLIDSALRTPQRVLIRPETKKKGYPVLGFYRGDVEVILGMRMPSAPTVIAAYHHSKLDPDNGHRTQGRTGGGGARRAAGLPRTVHTSIARLRSEGAEIEAGSTARSTEVHYRGQMIGKITLKDADRSQIERDYQRLLRCIRAIDEKQPA